MTDDESEAIIATFPQDYEPWRTKAAQDLTPLELSAAIADNQNIMWAAQAEFNSEEPMSREDREYAYGCMVRARSRVTDFQREKSNRFDVV